MTHIATMGIVLHTRGFFLSWTSQRENVAQIAWGMDLSHDTITFICAYGQSRDDFDAMGGGGRGVRVDKGLVECDFIIGANINLVT